LDFNKLLDGLNGWPAAIVLVAVILAVAWVVVTLIRSDND
jgi:hypothetical protein